jgi:hypothetical protein
MPRRVAKQRLAILLTVAALVAAPGALAQQGTPDSPEEAVHETGPFKRHRIAFFTGNTIVPSGGESEDHITTAIVPTLAFDYEYWFGRRFAIGWYNDFTLTTFFVETDREAPPGAPSSDSGNEIIQRKPVFLTAVVGIFEPVPRVTLYTGAGYEFEEEENLPVWKLGVEYSFPLPHDWDLALALAYDYKEVYDSISVGLSFGKRLGKPR